MLVELDQSNTRYILLRRSIVEVFCFPPRESVNFGSDCMYVRQHPNWLDINANDVRKVFSIYFLAAIQLCRS